MFLCVSCSVQRCTTFHDRPTLPALSQRSEAQYNFTGITTTTSFWGNARRRGPEFRLEDIIIHGSVAVCGSRSSRGRGGGAILVVGDKVVGHLRVQLLGGLLRGAAVATAAGLGPGGLAGSASLGAGSRISTVLDCGGGFGLSLRLAVRVVSDRGPTGLM